MRAVIQRVRRASVTVGGDVVGRIDEGALVLVGAGKDDTEQDVAWMAEKVANLRFFEDDEGRMSRSLLDIGGGVLAVSQFTLYGDCRKGRRPSFSGAMEPGEAERLYDAFCERVRGLGLRCETGRFGAMMEVELLNWGPVTLWVDSKVPRRSSG